LSCSHTVFEINVKQKDKNTKKELNGKLYLVDLACNQITSKTDEEKVANIHIKSSLWALTSVILALVKSEKHVPYRRSQLTRILEEFKSGYVRIMIILCCSPTVLNESETKKTIFFGQSAKLVDSSLVVNKERTAEELKAVVELYEVNLEKAKADLEKSYLREQVNQGEQVKFDISCHKESDLSTSSLARITDTLHAASGQAMSSFIEALMQSDVGLGSNSIQQLKFENSLLFLQQDDEDDKLSEERDRQIREQQEIISDLLKVIEGLREKNKTFEAENKSLRKAQESRVNQARFKKATEELVS
jgi:kinesin family protein 5